MSELPDWVIALVGAVMQYEDFHGHPTTVGRALSSRWKRYRNPFRVKRVGTLAH